MCRIIVFLLVNITYCIGYDILSLQQPANQTLTWFCTHTCHKYTADNAVDGDVTTCTKTQGISPKGPHHVRWHVDLGSVRSIHSVKIQFKDYKEYGNKYIERQKGRFAGFSLYVSNTKQIADASLCYKNQELPPLVFTTVCNKYGRYVIYYNERLAGEKYNLPYQEQSYTELCEITVEGCRRTGFYTKNCSLPCHNNCQEQRCDIVNGSCFGCSPGWTGLFCNKTCTDGFYGTGCNQTCSWHCAGNTTCHHVDGRCENLCAEGWESEKCNQACASGKYGQNCALFCSGNCLHNNTCNRFTGSCDNGCTEGYTGSLCDQECTQGFYGKDCSEICSPNCLLDSCNHVTGSCRAGCKAGYEGEQCDKICDNGRYWYNCSKECSPNCVNQSCDHEVGTCKHGCMPGWENSKCSDACSLQMYGKNCKQPCSGHCMNSKTCNHVDGTCDNGCADGYNGSLCDSICKVSYFGKNCSKSCSRNCSEPCDPVNGKCVCASEFSSDPYCKQEKKGNDEFRNSEDTLTAGVSVGTSMLLFFISVLATILFLRFRKKMKKERLIENEEMTVLPTEKNRTRPSIPRSKPDEQNTTVSVPGTPLLIDPGYANDLRGGLTRSNKTVSIKDLENTIEKMSQDDDSAFKNEYKQIRKGELHSCLEAKMPGNVAKNRYKTTYPYDHSRVVLKEGLSKESDYINANYIEDLQGQTSYIATQGPKPTTICDFWSMVWQENVKIIVCLTNLKEGTKIKCAQYWPDIRKIMKSGEFIIRNQKEIVYANYIRRTLCLKKKKAQKELMVMMFHYTKWSDHGVPDPLSIVIFHRHVMRTSESCHGKYILVHCSAGIGRTGTYIALDALYREGIKSGKVNVPKYVEIMRKDRMNMIQGHDQYKVVYLTLYESFRGKSKCVSSDQFIQEYGNSEGKPSKSQLYSGFKELVTIKRKNSAQDFGTGQANIDANFTTSVLPVEDYMCRLTYVKDRGTYYNAVFLQSFTSNDSLISAQFPLPDYTEDFLRLLKDFNVRIAVFMCHLRNVKSSALWFPFQRKEKTVGPFRIKFLDSTAATNITMTDIALTKEGSSDTRLTVIECTAWKDGMSSLDHRTLLDIVKETQIEDVPSDAKILVLSSDGAKRCGPFCVVYNALQQISLDKEVDLFTITRLLQIRRPEFISTLDEYQICHDALAEYLQNDTVYANC